MSEVRLQEVGEIKHYFSKINVAVVDLTGSLQVGDRIRIIGITTDFVQTVNSMEIEHKKVQKVDSGASIGLRIESRVREKDIVYKMV